MENAAKQERRSLSGLVEIILQDWLASRARARREAKGEAEGGEVSAELSIFGKRALAWVKRVFALAKRVATLEARVSALEAPREQHPPDVCDYCGERGMRKLGSGQVVDFGPGNQSRKDAWRCEKCGRMEDRVVRF